MNSAIENLNDNKTKQNFFSKKHRETYLVSFASFTERFSFWGLQATMLLFLVQSFAQSQNNAYTLVGIFGALGYAFSLLGGMLSDKLLGVWKSCLIGLTLCLSGNLVLAVAHDLIYLKLGFAFVLVGAGLFTPSSNNLIRMLYENKPDMKEFGFLLTCIAGNISGALGPLIYGLFLANNIGQGAFVVSAVFALGAIMCFVKNSHRFLQQSEHVARLKLALSVVAAFVVLAFSLLLYTSLISHLLVLSVIPLCVLGVFLFKALDVPELKRVGFLILLTAILMLFYTAVFQIYSSMTMFVANNVDRSVLGWNIPVPAFASLQCVFFILCAPFVERVLQFFRARGIDLSLLVRIPVGLLIGMVGFLVFAAAESVANHSGSCGMWWIVGGNFFLGLGEVLMYPPILSAIATFSPKRYAGTFMGLFSVALALASYFAGQLAKEITQGWVGLQQVGSVMDLGYGRVSLGLMGLVVLVGVVFLAVRRWYGEQYKIVYSAS